MARELLVDVILFDIKKETIAESLRENNGRLIVKNVVLQRANSKNYNERIYPKEILMREATKYLDTFIKERRALGELDHPDSSVVSLNNVSHNVLEMHWDGDDLIGTLEILTTPSGNILKELLKSGIKLGISSRGLGSVKEIQIEGDDDNSALEVQDDFELISFDAVSNPSTHGAFMNESIQCEKNKYKKVNSIITDILTT